MHRHIGHFVGRRFGAGSGRIWLDDVSCNGSESSITQCQHRGWGSHNCEHSEDVSISCISGMNCFTSLRSFVETTVFAGRQKVQIYTIMMMMMMMMMIFICKRIQ